LRTGEKKRNSLLDIKVLEPSLAGSYDVARSKLQTPASPQKETQEKKS